ncbi:c-type cytochrome biogenesis protein CcsB [Clavibacter michiganensis]|uniref:Cytochrome C biogenesis protein n=4 Tax=Clavibacter michiganensis TaxID=28447 RepID=A0A0D5CFW7_9MICO|nr:c-type cytochrome biogenesis protein CcsB [Clavibacter michiganensis]AJW78164.1 cytochrome C biogenesis protein [Clavibacter michiganensis subsp. insidiosus]AWF99436.1 c-type cytochrome biogenesis protein CcsB [Clavibacter michiganensis subsp. insidiosus]AWG00446.1 c-type cytochrome biogenesis protein CcsB [Clavibacter michiganensis subsp. insidiosus]OQJ60931.1 c-type cytochrome biogenesis protein CcsB [Clavibacter michiganensis subsp. insidiosus]RMC83827.1 c-type cytochrome biogenesis prot
MNTAMLDDVSLIALLVAMGLYAAAFIAFALDLARRSALVADAATVAARQPSAVGATAARRGGTATLEREPGSSDRDRVAAGPDAPVAAGRSVSLNVAMVLLVVGFVAHAVATVLRGLAASRVPWANMYEFAMTGTLLILSVYLIVLTRRDLRFLGTFVTGLILILLGIAVVQYRVEVAPLPPSLQSYWLVIHVFVAALGTGFFALAFALSGVQLLQFRRESLAADAQSMKMRFLATLPDSVTLESMAYRLNIVGFIFWTFTLMAGAVWAERAWGRYWGWDTKEVWTFIIWVLYAGYIHARATRGWRGSRSAWLAIIGFSAVMFNFGVVNVFFKGLHTYSGL